jgi:hypothetical protein
MAATAHPMWRQASSQAPGPLPNTAMCFAFVRAVYEWAARSSGVQRRMVIPTGEVDADELRRVVLALMAAKADADERS